jgi:hypothetical protein
MYTIQLLVFKPAGPENSAIRSKLPESFDRIAEFANLIAFFEDYISIGLEDRCNDLVKQTCVHVTV